MVRYKVLMTDEAKNDVRRIVGYIRRKLKEPETAVRIRNYIRKEVLSLHEMPERYALVQDAALARDGFRMTSAGNYLILYRVITQDRSVRIERILNGRQDWIHILQNSYL